MMTPEILAIVGALIGLIITIGLGINAFFVKGLFDSINQVKLQTTVLLERDTSKEARIVHVEENQKEIFYRLGNLERK